MRELYGTDVAHDLITRVTDAVLDEVRAWQARPLESVYPIVYLDALFVSDRDGGTVTKKAVYIAHGTTLEGRREVLSLWLEATEGAKFWLHVLTDLKIAASRTSSSSAATASAASRRPSRRRSPRRSHKHALCT